MVPDWTHGPLRIWAFTVTSADSQNGRLMFVRPAWRPQSADDVYRLIDEYPWALLVNNGADGPLVTNLPLMLERKRGKFGTLIGHIARANVQSSGLFDATAPTLAVFEGPYSYVTPSWYPNRDMPGTYYYTAVHCYGRLHPQTDAELEASLVRLNDRMETPIPNGWKINEVPRSEIARRLPLIAGFQMEIERLEAKFKLGQDEPKKDALAVADRLVASADPAQKKLGEQTRRENIGRSE
jgi:transcriptional regulator